MFTWGSNANNPDDPAAATAPTTEVEAAPPPAKPAGRMVAGLEDTVPRLPTGRPVGRVALPDDDPSLSPPAPIRAVGSTVAPSEPEPVFEEDPHEQEAQPGTSTAAAPEALEAHTEVYDLNDLLLRMVENHASDHLNVGSPPVYRIAGKLTRVAGPPLTREVARALLLPLLRPEQLERFRAAGNHDFAYELPDMARFRAHFFGQHFGLGAVFHRLPWTVPNLDELGLPDSLKNLCSLRSGLVVATGPSRSGKSTTIAAMIDHINHNRCEHVVTLEDPIEFYHDSDTCLIDHREIGGQTNSLADGFNEVFHEQPDIVVMGDLRDRESVQYALRAVEAGTLVFATMRSATAAEAVERLIDLFPNAEHDQTRAWLAVSLQAVLAHQLIHARGKSVLALEILVSNKHAVRLIRDAHVDELNEVMKSGSQDGMQTFDQALVELVASDRLDSRVARRLAVDPAPFE